jgi:hypothetical protein
MLDGALVKLDDGAVAQVKRLAVAGAPWQTLLVAVAPPPAPEPRPSLPEAPAPR